VQHWRVCLDRSREFVWSSHVTSPVTQGSNSFRTSNYALMSKKCAHGFWYSPREYSYCISGDYPLSCIYLKHSVSQTGFYFRLQVESTQLGPISVGVGVRRYGIALSIGPSWLCFTWRRRHNPVSETLYVF
jgi:hypothetical protein